MKQVPNEPPIIYINLENMREDADLLYWEYYQNSVVRMLRDAGIPEVAISVDKLAGFDDAFLVWGDFELKKIIYYLEDESWQQDTYREVEVWYRESGKVNEIALFKGEIIMGEKGCVKRIIRVIKGEEESLYGNKDAVDVVNKLSDGFIIMIGGMTELNQYYLGQTGLPAPATEGGICSSEKKISKDKIKLQVIYKCDNERTAEGVATQMEQQYKESEIDVEITTQDEYMIFSRVLNISEYFGG